jgi:PhnB protein
MKIRPYLTFNGECSEAIALYERAFHAEVLKTLRFGELPQNPAFSVPEAFRDRVVQCTLNIGNDFIRLSDCGPGHDLNAQETERISLAVETDADSVRHAFSVLAEEGQVGMPLEETFYSPCAGVVFDKFGVMWNLVAQK